MTRAEIAAKARYLLLPTTTYHLLPTTSTTYHLLPTTYSPTTYHLLLAYYLPPTTRLLPTTYYSPTTYHLLTYYLPPTYSCQGDGRVGGEDQGGGQGNPNPNPDPNPNPNPNPTPSPSPDPHQAKRELAKSGGNDYMGALSTNDNSLEELSAHGTDRRLHTARPLPARPAQHRPSTGHLHLCL
jgi:hypothetical protein